MMQTTWAMLQVMSALLGTFREKNMTGPWEVQKCPKKAKIESYNTHFRTYSGPELRTPRDAS